MATHQKAELLTFKMNDVTVFGSWPDMANACLNQAHGMLAMLDNQEVATAEYPEANAFLGSLNPVLKASAFEGIQTLIALASFAIQQDGRCVS